MFNSIEEVFLDDFNNEELMTYFVPSNFCLILNNGHKYGPFGTNSFRKKTVTIQIGNGDILAQTTSSFIYDYGRKTFKNDKCFSFYVSNEMKILGVADGFRIET